MAAAAMTLGQALDETASRHSDRPFLLFRDEVYSYRSVAALTDRLAAGLLALGLRKGDFLALWLPNRLEFAFSYFAAAKAGLVLVPINTFFKGEELAYLLADSGAKAIITCQDFLPVLEQVRPRVPNLEQVITVERGWKEVMRLGGSEPEVSFKSRVRPGDVASCLYTSGTTGEPKGALLTHHNLTWDANACTKALPLSAQDRLLCVLPLFHSFAQTICLALPTLFGGSTLLLDRFSPAAVLQALAQGGVTVFPGVPAIFAALLQVPAADRPPHPALRFCVSGAAPLPPEVMQAFEKEYRTLLLEGDGPTECSPVTCVNPYQGPRKPGSVGLPLPGVEIRIFDEEDRELPPGEVGEVVVRGENVMLGYHNRPEETAQALRGGWFHTGDLGRFDEGGYLYLVDRKKDMIIVGGLKVYPREVELALLSHPAVAEAAVVGVPDQARGELPAAFVALREGKTATAKELTRYCRERLANFKVPRAVYLLDSLPKTGTGKTRKQDLKPSEPASERPER